MSEFLWTGLFSQMSPRHDCNSKRNKLICFDEIRILSKHHIGKNVKEVVERAMAKLKNVFLPPM